ncbi:hypothetical protein PRZ48_011231 [Zasmidium cellare]|uniref:Glycoside hydrolase family 17 protein n=1 Tax=Zasmidium cellare TaxID=395010 RepID=A0ABR0EBI9_ZASCE|nr:hypothetical protein PRZ48_011231 [Zasmidium cellare]
MALQYLFFGNLLPDQSAKLEDDFYKEFTAMRQLENSPGMFNSVRLYTNIQADTEATPILAFPAAIRANMSILLGIWCSGSNNITNELNALNSAINQYGDDFVNAVIGISVGSEDMYRITEKGVESQAGVGQGPEMIVKFINDTREAIEGTALGKGPNDAYYNTCNLTRKPVGHVDTWTAWVNSSNSAVIDAIDWAGVDIYPYYEKDENNTFANAKSLFDDLYNMTLDAIGDKPVWVTETGWPFTGISWGRGEPSVDNQRDYWREIGCSELFGRVNTWWYTLRDANAANKQQFAITDDVSTTPHFDMSCPAGRGAPATINERTSTSLATKPLVGGKTTAWASVLLACLIMTSGY